MPNPPITKADAEHICGILNAARQVVGSAKFLFSQGMLGETMVENVMGVQGEIGSYLAFFTDGAGYGWAKPDAVEEMRDLEYECQELLYRAAQCALTQDSSP